MRAPGRTFAVTAALALALTACGGGDDGNGNGDDGGDAGGEAATSVTLEGTDSLAWEPESFTVAAGEEVEVTINCGPTVEHNFLIEGYEGDAVIAECAADGSGTGTFNVEAGDYVFYCSIPGHREAGMEGTFTAS